MSISDAWWSALQTVIVELDTARIDYTILDVAALLLQDISVPDATLPLKISVQWDLFSHVQELLAFSGQVDTCDDASRFVIMRRNVPIEISCLYNTVVRTDVDRLSLVYKEQMIWVKAPDYYVHHFSSKHAYVQAIKAYWQVLQRQNSSLSEQAWNQDTYDAWTRRLGDPQDHAEYIKKNPRMRLSTLLPYLGDVAGKKIVNLLGSHGTKAIALSLLGAEVTVVDISQGNAQYAQEVARYVPTPLQYITADALHLPAHMLDARNDIVVMELGILHYFVDLEPLARIVYQLLQPGGKMILQDFHPFSTKLITSHGKKHKVDGNYFDKTLMRTRVAFSKHLPDERQAQTTDVYLRKWTLGEIVTAMATSGLHICQLIEEPNSKVDDIGLPKTFTLIAQKLSAN